MRAMMNAKITNWVSMLESAKGNAGWLTTASTKEKMALTTRTAIEEGRICFAKDFFSLTLNPVVAKKRVRDELARYSAIVQPSKTLFGATRKTFSGKISGQCDDVAIVLQIAVQAIVQFFSDKKYERFVRS